MELRVKGLELGFKDFGLRVWFEGFRVESLGVPSPCAPELLPSMQDPAPSSLVRRQREKVLF